MRLDSDAPIGYQHTIVARWGGSYSLEISASDQAIFRVRNSANALGQVASVAPLARGVWHHVVGIFNGGLVTVWVDGVQGGSQSIGGVLQNAGPSPDRTLIGATGNGSTSSYNFKGLIDEVAIYGRALSPSEVTSHWTALADLNGDGILDL